MPEIPEMELYKNQLNQRVKNKSIDKVIIYREKSINLPVSEFGGAVTDNRIGEVERRGKYLIFILERGYLLAHMMLDGRLYYLSPGQKKQYDLAAGEVDNEQNGRTLDDSDLLREKIPGLSGRPSVLLYLNDGGMLFFCQLNLGYLHYLDEQGLRKQLRELGREPLDPDFQAGDFKQLLKGKKGMIKPWLINQKNLAGVGNAYSNEALFRAGIHPTRQIGSLSGEEQEKLYHELRSVMAESIQKGGDMEEPFMPGDELTGGFNPYFKAYDQEGQPCPRCGNPIQRAEVGGRNAFYCESCQQ